MSQCASPATRASRRLLFCALALALGLALPPAAAADAFSRLDRDANGALSAEELERAEPAPGGGWIAIDRDDDGRYGRGEFDALEPAGAAAGRWDTAALRGGFSARRLIGAPARDLRGEWLASRFLGGRTRLRPGVYADVEDLVVSPSGELGAVVVASGPDGRRGRHAYPWHGPARMRDLQPFDYRALDIAAPAGSGGCWMHVYAEPGYRGRVQTYTGPTHGHFALRGEGSLLLGPGARLRGFADAGYDVARLALPPGTHVVDLLAAGLQNHARSFRLECVEPPGG